MFVLVRSCLFVIVLISLTACGGGGSGGGTVEDATALVKSPEATKLYYQSLAESSYIGKSDPARLDASSLVKFMDYLFDPEDNQVDVISSGAELNSPGQYDNLPEVRSFSTQTRQLLLLGPVSESRQTSSSEAAKAVTASQTVNETYSCAGGGYVRYLGNLTNSGTGVLEVSYHACVRNNGLVINGKGHQSIESDVTNRLTLYYDAVTFSDENGGATLSGYITTENPGPTSNTREIYFLTVTDFESGEQLAYRNFIIDSDSVGEINFSGEMMIDTLGSIAVNSNGLVLDQTVGYQGGEVEFASEASSGKVAFYGDRKVGIYLDEDNDDSYEKVLGLNDGFNAVFSGDIAPEDLNWNQELNFPPVFETVGITSDGSGSTLDTWSAEVGSIVDYDGDDITILEYRWYVNDELMQASISHQFPPYKAAFGDTISLEVVATDGKSTTTSQKVTVSVGDAPFIVEIGEFPEIVEAGQTISFPARVTDPDNIAGPYPAVLISPPEGMAIDSDGILNWTVPEPAFGDISRFRLKIETIDGVRIQVEKTIVVQGSASAKTIVAGDIVVPIRNHSLFVGNFDQIPGNEVLTSDSAGHLMLIKEEEGNYKPSWMYPYGMSDLGIINQTALYDNDLDGSPEIYMATAHSVVYMAKPADIARTVKDYGSYIPKAIEVGDFNSSGTPQIAVIYSESRSSDSNCYLEIIDAHTGNRLFHTSIGERATEVVAGNLDDDENLEIAINNGWVFDGRSYETQWEYTEGFGDYIALGNIEDGASDEIVGANRDTGVAAFSLIKKQKLWDLDRASNCSVLVANIDADSLEEIILGDCESSSITAYDTGTGVPLVDWQYSSIGQRVYSLVLGDIDNDGDSELLWGTGKTESTPNQLVVAEVNGNTHVEISQNTTQMDRLVGNGWASVGGKEKAVFTASPIVDDTKGPRFVQLDHSGSFSVSGEFSPDQSIGYRGIIVDSDSNGDSELLVTSHDANYGGLTLLDLNDYGSIWSSEVEENFFARLIRTADINGDDHPDALYANINKIKAVDIYHRSELSIEIDPVAYIADFYVTDITGDSVKEFLIATTEDVEVWESVDGHYQKTSSLGLSCRKIVPVNVDADPLMEIGCVTGNIIFGPSKLTIYDLSSTGWYELIGKDYDQAIVGISSVPDYPGAIAIGAQYYDRDLIHFHSNVFIDSLITGETLWSSPSIAGRTDSTFFKFRSAAEADGGPRLMMGAYNTMYLFQ
ncbi:hypothetical protein BTA51_09170 [Hahella sp. CCB-MM4]|uniref:hypothetical protein n=1 Tax=Hahella sp. (strain CCB-MM4) TaxID=1926491 RepID=UPI000B9BD904|nr:hypothetical protein [Hahella sp. CCB-MM4]OZG73941.1 hypothetical protein BTA51_09170 [Hahella sp. CCB-MM4]